MVYLQNILFLLLKKQHKLTRISIPREILEIIEDFRDNKFEYTQYLNVFSNYKVSRSIINTITNNNNKILYN